MKEPQRAFSFMAPRPSAPCLAARMQNCPRAPVPEAAVIPCEGRSSPKRGSKHSSRAFPMPGSQPQDPQALPQSPAPSPLPELLLSSHKQRLWDPRAHPVGSPTVCPWPWAKAGPFGLLPFTSCLSPLPCLLCREGKKQKAPGCGVLFHFIQVPLKRSLYKSEHEDAQETSPGLHGRWRMLRSANVHIYREPPEKKRGRRKSQAW